jgi:hypothetical protein
MKITDLERDTVLQYGWNWPTFRHGDTSKITASFVMPAQTSNLTQDEKVLDRTVPSSRGAGNTKFKRLL